MYQQPTSPTGIVEQNNVMIAASFWKGISIRTGLLLVLCSAVLLACDNAGWGQDRSSEDLIELDAANADWIFVGNSMTAHNVDASIVSRETGKNVVNIGIPGTSSPVWYLQIKKIITQLQRKPSVVIICFQKNSLISGPITTGGANQRHMIRLGALSDEDVIAFMEDDENWFHYFLLQRVPLLAAQEDVREALLKSTRLIAAALAKKTTDDVSEIIKNQFAEKNLSDGAHDMIVDDKNLRNQGGRNLPESLLPAMATMLAQENIQLVLVNVKEQIAFREGAVETKATRLIREFADKNDIVFLDYSDNQILTKRMFRTGNHLNNAGIAKFSMLLAKDITEAIAKKNR